MKEIIENDQVGEPTADLETIHQQQNSTDDFVSQPELELPVAERGDDKAIADDEHIDRPPGKERPDHQRVKSVDQFEVAPDHKAGDQPDYPGQHHGGQQDDEQRVPPGEAKAGKAVGHYGATEDLGCHPKGGDE